jgi:hypothetical protein
VGEADREVPPPPPPPVWRWVESLERRPAIAGRCCRLAEAGDDDAVAGGE